MVFCFAGQGSQYYNMAAELYRQQSVFRQWLQIGDEIVRARHGHSLLEAIYDPRRGPADTFDRLEITHPGVFLVQYALARLLLHLGVRPDAMFGVSLGEVVGMTAAGVASFEPVLISIAAEADIFQQSCRGGGMTAVLGPASLCDTLPDVEIAGINADRHCIIAGPSAGLAAAERNLAARGVPFQRLPVAYPFHSRWINPAEIIFSSPLNDRLRPPRWPCWSSCLAAPVDPGISGLAWRIVREPMRVQQTVRAIEAAGGAVYVDLSPSGTFAGILRQSIAHGSPSRVVPVLSPFGGCAARLSRAMELLAVAARSD